MLLAFLIFLPTIIFFPHTIYTLGVLYIPKNIKFDINLFIILLIIILSIFNQILNLNDAIIYNKTIFTFFPYYILILISFFISKSINEKTKKFLILFVFIETIIAIIEFVNHVPTFFPSFVSSQLPTSYGYKGLLYYSRVFGLSNNSSELSFKIFASLLLLETINLRNYFKHIIYIVFIIGIYITFNRSVILSLSIFYFLKFYPFVFNYIKSNVRKFPKKYLIFSIIIILIIIFTIYYFNNIIFQFTRGMSLKLDTYKRNEIYDYFFNFILKNPIMGNGSYKLYYLFQDRLYHAHNSFIQIIATNGFIIASLYLLLVFKNTNRFNFNYILSFIALSFTQYAIFWGISFLDIILFYFLFNSNKLTNEQ